jgi:ligand-binding SRPBCC domain-containing protein
MPEMFTPQAASGYVVGQQHTEFFETSRIAAMASVVGICLGARRWTARGTASAFP